MLHTTDEIKHRRMNQGKTLPALPFRQAGMLLPALPNRKPHGDVSDLERWVLIP
jgi:hypothetical protein